MRISLWLQLQISQRRNVSNRGRIRKKSGLKKIRRRIQVFTRYPNRGTFSITITMHSLFWIFERMQIRGGHAWQFGWWSSTFSRWKFERGRARWRMIVVLERGSGPICGATWQRPSCRHVDPIDEARRGETRTRYSAMLTRRKQSSATRLRGSAYFHPRNFNLATLQMRLLEREPNTFSLHSSHGLILTRNFEF